MDHDVLVVGETLIDFLSDRAGSLEDVASFERRPGGAPANVAVALAKLEHTPLFWTRVGDDAFGRYLEGVLDERGLPDRFLERDPDAKTSLAFVTHDETGDREFTFYRGGTADTRLEPGRIDEETLAALEWVHAGGVTLASGSSRRATLDLLERAAAADCTVSFDPNARPELWPDAATVERVCRDALAHVDVCKATAAELEGLGFDGATPLEIGRETLAAGPHTVFVTRGSEGAVAVADERAPWTDAEAASSPMTAETDADAVDVVDTTGAGDAFVAGAITSLREGRSLEESLSRASAVAALATTEPGAMSALPDRDAVRAFRRDR